MGQRYLPHKTLEQRMLQGKWLNNDIYMPRQRNHSSELWRGKWQIEKEWK